MSHLSLGPSWPSPSRYLILMLIAAVVAVTKMGALADRTPTPSWARCSTSRSCRSRSPRARRSTPRPMRSCPAPPDWTSGSRRRGRATAATPSPRRSRRPRASPCSTCRAHLKADKAAGEALQASIARTVELVRNGDIEAAQANRQRSTLRRSTHSWRRTSRRGPVRDLQRGGGRGRRSTAAGGKRLIIIVTIALLLAGACAFVITRGITRRVAVILDRLALAQRQLTRPIFPRRPGRRRDGDLTHPVAFDHAASRTRLRRDRPRRRGRERDPRQHRGSIDAYNHMARNSPG